MGNCAICKMETESWETLCKSCWRRAEEAYRMKRFEDGELVVRLKGKAKSDLLDLMKELCKNCPKSNEDLTAIACESCIHKEKEKLIRAFID